MHEAVTCLRQRVIHGEVPGLVLVSFPLNWKPNHLVSSRNSKRFPDASHTRFLRRKMIQIRAANQPISPLNFKRVSRSVIAHKEPLSRIDQPLTEEGHRLLLLQFAAKTGSIHAVWCRTKFISTHLQAHLVASSCTNDLIRGRFESLRSLQFPSGFWHKIR